MNKWNETGLPESITSLINSEKEAGLNKFQISGFEKKIYNRIRDQKRGRRISSKWMLIPASLILVFISVFLLFKGIGDNLTEKSNFQLVLETVINDNSHSREVSAVFEKEREKFEKLQNRILSSDIIREISSTYLSEHITSLLLSASGEYEQEFKFFREYNERDFLQIKKDRSIMNKKDDYSELFSRIIINLTEG